MTLRPSGRGDLEVLAEIRSTPEVFERWRGEGDLLTVVAHELADEEAQTFVIEHEAMVVGAIQWGSEEEPDYRHASIDIYLSPTVHGRGLGTAAVRLLARHLIFDHGFRRLVIDPASDNAPAIRCYAKVGFRPVGIMREYERGVDGTWHDGLLMDLLAGDLIEG